LNFTNIIQEHHFALFRSISFISISFLAHKGKVGRKARKGKVSEEGSCMTLAPGRQPVTVDLAAMHEIYAVVFWPFLKTARVCFDVIAQLADDAGFSKKVRTLCNDDHDNPSKLGAGKDIHYVEASEGRLVDAKRAVARYVRLYSNGNHADERNHYVEIEVFGRPVK